LSFPPEVFAWGLRRLAARGWKTVLPSAVGCANGERLFAITFDDAYRTVVLNAWPVMRELGMTGVVFVNPMPEQADGLAPMEGRERLAWSDLRHMMEGGMEVGAHSLRHVDLTRLGEADLDQELGGAKERLERELAAPVRMVAYPYGHESALVRSVAARYYGLGFGSELRTMTKHDDRMALPRLEMHYFREAWSFGLLGGPWTEAYLTLRRGPRMVRQWLRRMA
jgi:peptidoglycan/xylan/chitin deacetylase (PgdA/CDA1 family)